MTGLPPDADFTPHPRSWLRSRLRTVTNFAGFLTFTVLTGGYSYFAAPFKLKWPRIDLPLPGLHPDLAGYRIVQLSDLHAGYSTPLAYLRDVVRKVNDTPHDLVVITGDFVTHRGKWIPAAIDVVADLRGPTVAVLGNHDYAETWRTWTSTELADVLQRDLRARRIRVLRNEAIPIRRGEGRAWVAGYEDLWSGRFNPGAALRDVPPGEPVIALAHNPDCVYPLAERGVHYVLAGHTHGGQIRLPLVGSMILPIDNKKLDYGHFTVKRTKMYVTSGVGFATRARFRCPPEVPVFTLRPDAEPPPAA